MSNNNHFPRQNSGNPRNVNNHYNNRRYPNQNYHHSQQSSSHGSSHFNQEEDFESQTPKMHQYYPYLPSGVPIRTPNQMIPMYPPPWISPSMVPMGMHPFNFPNSNFAPNNPLFNAMQASGIQQPIPHSSNKQFIDKGVKKQKTKYFDEYWDQDIVELAINNGRLIKGALRVNNKNYKECYVNHPSRDADILIFDTKRNRALNDDIVAVVVESMKNWKVTESLLHILEGKDDYVDSLVEDTPSDKVLQELCEDLPQDQIEPILSELQRININPASTKSSNVTDIDRKKEVSSITSGEYCRVEQLMKIYPDMLTKVFSESINIDSNRDPDIDQSPIGNKWWHWLQRTGRVVSIVRPMHTRVCVGTLNNMSGNKSAAAQHYTFIKFSPVDSRIPRIHIPVNECPAGFMKNPDDFKDSKFVVKILDWKETDRYPRGTLKKSVCDASIAEAETERILIECGIETEEFSKEVMSELADTVDVIVTAEDLKYRRDFRHECVFSIDPKTARDLDDALHIRKLSADEMKKYSLKNKHQKPTWEVGVHIADVSHYVVPGSKLDLEASARATTVYLVQRSVPMLPRILCERLCSLQPGSDRLAFSIVYILTDEAEVLDTWIGKSIINSCAQLSYEDAQHVIDEPNKTDWTTENLPVSAPFNPVGVSTCIRELNNLAVLMRKKRFEQGALRLNATKISFVFEGSLLISEDANQAARAAAAPTGFRQQQLGPSNHMIEEWMLKANMSVAQFLDSHLPELAFLRSHPRPSEKNLADLERTATLLGLNDIDTRSSDSIQKALYEFEQQRSTTENNNAVQVLVNVCSKAMQLAVYFCAGTVNNRDDYSHYALNVNLYTHFTSPIRRYPDVIVHRQLAYVLSQNEFESDPGKQKWLKKVALPENAEPLNLQLQAEVCNKKKKDAKSANDMSVQLYFSLFVKECKVVTETAVVMGLLDQAFDVLLVKCGLLARVYADQLDQTSFKLVKPGKGKLKTPGKPNSRIEITWVQVKCNNTSNHPPNTTSIKLLSTFDAVLSTYMALKNGYTKLTLRVIMANPGCKLCAASNNESTTT